MQVRIRHIDESHGRLFCEIEPTREAIESLVAMIKQSGGVNYYDDVAGGVEMKNVEYRFCLDEDGAYCELLISPEEE